MFAGNPALGVWNQVTSVGGAEGVQCLKPLPLLRSLGVLGTTQTLSEVHEGMCAQIMSLVLLSPGFWSKEQNHRR